MNHSVSDISPFDPPASFKGDAKEWRLRVDLAASYRLVSQLGLDDAIFTHISLRLPTETPSFLINGYGLLFDEITASNLVVVDVHGNKLCDSPLEVNPAGFDIHSAIHMANSQAHCVMHTHTLAGMSVSALREGLLPVNQMSMKFFNRIARYSYDTIHFDEYEKSRLVATLGSKKALLMENHGLLTCGRTVAEAFYFMYYLEKACRVQLSVLATGRPAIIPSDAACESAAALFEDRSYMRDLMWNAFTRQLERDCPQYRL